MYQAVNPTWSASSCRTLGPDDNAIWSRKSEIVEPRARIVLISSAEIFPQTIHSLTVLITTWDGKATAGGMAVLGVHGMPAGAPSNFSASCSGKAFEE